ncbi:AraC family transcriptional regulator [Paenibacillus sp. HWE-109]|uniref:AraC family transcriptional regulator n=1 Tax=Paenibacillus sp. HWE-109 TaxID=1306526 RepID=UPI001EE13299|nr:AraC family transcriptional regulator [Paenibacillus sp. HWE-109]UKS28331.1 AraC family transcriptional regulator [Paenibacillus sp. HWE-109]
MHDSPFLLTVLNSLDFTYFKGNTTRFDVKKSHSFDQPFTLISQITDGPLLLHIGNESYKVEPGQGLIIPPHTKYEVNMLEPQFVTHWLNVDITLFDHFKLFDFIETPYVTSEAIGNNIGRLQTEITALMNTDPIDTSTSLYKAAQVKQRLFTLLEVVLSVSRYKIGSFENMRNLQRFQPVFDYMEKHLTEKIKVTRMAEVMYLSISHFHKEFKQAFQVSPMQYVQAQRLKKAQYLLATTDLTMGEIANRIGYDHTYPFIRFFKSMYGSSPGKYKKALTRL